MYQYPTSPPHGAVVLEMVVYPSWLPWRYAGYHGGPISTVLLILVIQHIMVYTYMQCIGASLYVYGYMYCMYNSIVPIPC